jgi:hypothetical protein
LAETLAPLLLGIDKANFGRWLTSRRAEPRAIRAEPRAHFYISNLQQAKSGSARITASLIEPSLEPTWLGSIPPLLWGTVWTRDWRCSYIGIDRLIFKGQHRLARGYAYWAVRREFWLLGQNQNRSRGVHMDLRLMHA